MKRILPVIIMIIILAGACWWCSAASDLAQPTASPAISDAQTATADSSRHWSYYNDPETGFNLILPASWFGSFVDADYSNAELVSIQSQLPYFGSRLEEVSELGENRPLFLGMGRILSDESTFQPAELLIYRFDRAAFPAINEQAIEETYESNRRDFIKQYADEITSNTLVSVNNAIYEFSYCSKATNTDASACIIEYDVLTDELICVLFFSTSSGYGSSAQDDFQSIAKRIRCQ